MKCRAGVVGSDVALFNSIKIVDFFANFLMLWHRAVVQDVSPTFLPLKCLYLKSELKKTVSI